MKKKITYIITKATWGGAQRYVADLMTHLPTEEFDVSILYGEEGRLAKEMRENGFHAERIPQLGRDITLYSDIVSFFGILKYLRRERPDIVHLNSSKAAALGAIAARIAHVPHIVFSVHGWPYKEVRSRVWRWGIYFVSWITAVLSDDVIVVSKADEVQGHQMAFIGHKVVYIPIGIDVQTLLPREQAWKAIREKIAVDIPHDTVRIVTIAELTANKGLRFMLKAAAILKEQNVQFSYIIIGEGELRAALQRQAEDLAIGDRVHFTGFMDDASKYLRAFDIFVLPSVKEGMPYVLLEAANAELPIVTTKTVNPEFVGSYDRARAVPSGDAPALAAAISEAIAGKNAESPLFTSRATFSLERMVRSTIDVYNAPKNSVSSRA